MMNFSITALFWLHVYGVLSTFATAFLPSRLETSPIFVRLAEKFGGVVLGLWLLSIVGIVLIDFAVATAAVTFWMTVLETPLETLILVHTTFVSS